MRLSTCFNLKLLGSKTAPSSAFMENEGAVELLKD